jgi:nitrogen regulatory protein PII 2
MTAGPALGRGKGIVDMDLLQGAEKGYEEAISQLGQSGRLIPKRLLFMVLPNNLVDKAVKTIIKVNQTGKSGDGVIYVTPAVDSINVRTGESGDATLDEG